MSCSQLFEWCLVVITGSLPESYDNLYSWGWVYKVTYVRESTDWYCKAYELELFKKIAANNEKSN